MQTIQQIIRAVNDLKLRVAELESKQVVPEVVQVVPVVEVPVVETPTEGIEIPDAPVAFEGPRRGRPRKIVE